MGPDQGTTLVFSFHNVGPRDQAQGARLGHRCIYPLSRFNSPGFIIVYWGEFEGGIISTLGADAPTAQERVPIAHSPASPSLGGNTLDPNC